MTTTTTTARPDRRDEARDLGPVGHYRELARRLEEGLARAGGAAAANATARALRAEAIEKFAALGFPTTKHEDWRFTSVAGIAREPWKAAEPGAERCGECAEALRTALAPLYFGDWAGARVVLVNGRHAPALSRAAEGLPAGTFVGSLADALAEVPALVEPLLGRQARGESHGFPWLNTAFLEDGAFIHIPAGVVFERPIVVIHATFAPEPIAVFPRTLIVAGDRSQATVVEVHVGRDGERYFADSVVEVVAGESAVLEHVKVAAEGQAAQHVATIEARCARAASFRQRNISYGGALVRNDLTAVLAGEGGDYQLDGLYIGAGAQHLDNRTIIDHAAPHCGGREVYRGILDGRSFGIFNGRIIVRPGAQKTDAKQTNKNLLLSDEAQVETKPQLEIYANDVKCTHGATVGRLDPDALFYLRSRGLPLAEARSTLTYAFASEVVQRVGVEPVRAELEALILRRFGA